MKPKVFIDGEAGTTGLQIRDRLAGRTDLELVQIDPAQRKNDIARHALMQEADVVVLCLPDDAARQAVQLASDANVKIIDASTAHRTEPGWVFGFPEMTEGHADTVAAATRISNPGCYPTGAIALLRPLTERGLLPRDAAVTINAISGYSGGGRRLIERFEDKTDPEHLSTGARLYALGLEHKHVPELQLYALLDHPPLFAPAVGRFRQGMIVQVPLLLRYLEGVSSAEQVHAALREHYEGQPFVDVMPMRESLSLEGIAADHLNGTNKLQLHVLTNETNQHVLLVAVLDNLGKGASGAAVQSLNLILGLSPTTGLVP